MKLSMWIFAEWLKEFSPELHIRDGGLHIETVRLFSSGSASDDSCLYIGRMKDLFVQGNDNVICSNRNDILILPTSDLDEIMNQTLNAIDYYQNWNIRILEAISSDLRPSEILDIADPVLQEPVYLLGSNQFVIALSREFGRGTVNPLWDQMLESGSADLAFLSRLNIEFPQHLSRRGLYYFSVPFVEQSSFNYNMFFQNRWIGLCSMVERTAPMPQHKIDLFHIFCQNLELWFTSHSQEQHQLVIDSLLRDAVLTGQTDETFPRQYLLRFQTVISQKKLLVLISPTDNDLLLGHINRELNLAFPQLISIILQNRICILLNGESENSCSIPDGFSDLLQRYSFYGGCSLPFIDLHEIHSRYTEAAYTAEQMSPGNLLDEFRNYALPYALEKIRDTIKADPIHPDVRMLTVYDRKHHTEFAHTLDIYLREERSQSRTAARLNLHRNTLTYRLQRIRELLTCDLDEENVRLHLLLSFRFSDI